MDILNYQGNKAKLLTFIDTNLTPLLKQDKALLDIFSGGASVSAFFVDKTKVISNDLEPYAFHIANSLISPIKKETIDNYLKQDFRKVFQKNYKYLSDCLIIELDKEKEALQKKDTLKEFYEELPTLWNEKYSKVLKTNITVETVFNRKNKYSLFTLLYSSNYFGLRQAIEIDSIICAINAFGNELARSSLFAALFYAMNKCVFSKDGHMAQPLNIEKNLTRCINCRNKSIIDHFYKYFDIREPVHVFSLENKAYNLEFEELLKIINPNEIGCIYADPPYTDMQYSRYYHLLNIACEYNFSIPTMKSGKYSSGLYLSERRQSTISVRKTFLDKMEKLCSYAKRNKINLVISFGYPNKHSDEKNDRYLCSIDQLFETATKVFGKENICLKQKDYEHANQRNSKLKKVIEYLILCKGK